MPPPLRSAGRTGRTAPALVFALGLASGLTLALLARGLGPWRFEPDLALYREVRDFVRESFVADLDDAELADRALHGVLESLDGYSRYYDPGEVEALQRETRGRYRGFGLVLTRSGGPARVLFALPDSPAEAAGLRVGEELLAVDGQALDELGEDGLQSWLDDESRERVRFRLRSPEGVQREVELGRAELVDPTVRHARLVDEERGIGYLAIRSFSHETPAEFDRTVEHLRRLGARALVLDLRDNGGGVLGSAVALARRFVREGVIVSTEGRGEPVVHRAEEVEAWYADMPLCVLVDGGSASASEVLAAALQDHRAGVLCGEPTWGKGVVQSLRHFDGGARLAKVTSSYYYTPARRNLERTAGELREHGLAPDLVVELEPLERRTVHAWLARYDPPEDAREQLAEWERRERLELVGRPPPDAQLDAALGLLRGRRPPPRAGAGS